MALALTIVGAAAHVAAGNVYVGGDFHKWVADGGEERNMTGLAQFNESGMAPVGFGMDLPAVVHSVDFHGTLPQTGMPALYVGGAFTLANGEEVSRISRNFNGSMEEVGAPAPHACPAARALGPAARLAGCAVD
jgi:hypothetical protein